MELLAERFRREAELLDAACPHLSEAFLSVHMRLLDELRQPAPAPDE